MKTDPSSMWDKYKKALGYQISMRFAVNWPEYIRFVEGNQWPAPTEKTKNMPRPVINQCDFIVENKQSNILSQSLKMVYSPEEIPEGGDTGELSAASDDMTDAAANTWNDIDQDALNEDFVNDTLTIGSGVMHFYFDNNLKGGQFTPYVGKVQGEVIDPMDFFLGNPQLKSHQIQKQPWIMIRTREDTDTLKEITKANGGEWQKIQPDENRNDERYDNAQKDMEEPNKTTCLTVYYKEKGQVHWTKICEAATIQKPRPLAPKGSTKPFEVYPVEMLVFRKRHKCAYGRSILEDIIAIQRSFNTGIGLMLLSVQQTAWPKMLAKVGALTQAVTNEPGEIIIDNFSNPGIDGVKFMQPPNFSTMPVLLTDKLLELTRQVTGTTEVNTGEVLGANMAAAAIIALQNQAKKPNEAYQNKLFRSIKNIGRIWEEFYKCYYNIPRPVQSTDKEGNPITKKFTGSQYADMGFGLKIDVGPASVFSESLQVAVLDRMVEKQMLDKYQYAKYLPSNILPSELKQDFEKEYEALQEQQQLQGAANNILSQLTPEELAELQSNPQLLQQVMGSMGGGNNAMPVMP